MAIGDEHSPRSVLVIGCGRYLRRDDQVGLLIAERLRQTMVPLPEGITVHTTEAPCATMFADADADREALLVLIDAARGTGGVAPGSVLALDYHAQPERLRVGGRTNTHTLSVDAALGLGRELNLLPAQVWIYAVAGVDFDYGETLSPEVAKVIPEVVARIRQQIETFRPTVSS